MYDQVRRRRYNVVMSGYYGFSNAGDDAILQSIQEGIVAASEDISITVLSNDPALTERLYGLDAVPRFQIWKVLRALRRCDALLSGGGASCRTGPPPGPFSTICPSSGWRSGSTSR